MRAFEHLIYEFVDHWEISYRNAREINEHILRLVGEENKISVEKIRSAFNILNGEDFTSFITELRNVLDEYWGKENQKIFGLTVEKKAKTIKLDDPVLISYFDRDKAKRIVKYYIKELIKIGEGESKIKIIVNKKEMDAHSIAKEYLMMHRMHIINEVNLQDHLRKIKKIYPEVTEDRELENLVCNALIPLSRERGQQG